MIINDHNYDGSMQVIIKLLLIRNVWKYSPTYAFYNNVEHMNFKIFEHV